MTLMLDSIGGLQSILGNDNPAMTSTGFFPAPQRQVPVQSQITLPAVSTGSARALAPDAPSIAQTAAWAYKDWFNSPYEAQLAPTVKPTVAPAPKWNTNIFPAENQNWFDRLADPWKKSASNLFSSSGQALLNTWDNLPNLLLKKVGLIPETQTVNTAGTKEVHVYQTESKSPQPAISEQPTGLFNLGYLTGQQAQAASAKPAAPAAPTVQRAGGGGTLLIAGFVLLFLLSKK